MTLTIGIASPQHLRRVLVVGTQGTLELRDGYDKLVFGRTGAPGVLDAVERTFDAGDGMPLLAELQRFLGFVAGNGPPPMSSAAEGLLIVERLAAIEKAAVLSWQS